MEGAIALTDRYDAEFLDALIFSWNERQIPPEQRVEDYLKRCHEQMQKDDPKRLEESVRAKEGDRVIVIG